METKNFSFGTRAGVASLHVTSMRKEVTRIAKNKIGDRDDE